MRSEKAFILFLLLHCSISFATSPMNNFQQGRVQKLSDEETTKGVNEGKYCTDESNMSYELGEIIKRDGQAYICSKVFVERLEPSKKLVWAKVEISEQSASLIYR